MRSVEEYQRALDDICDFVIDARYPEDVNSEPRWLRLKDLSWFKERAPILQELIDREKPVNPTRTSKTWFENADRWLVTGDCEECGYFELVEDMEYCPGCGCPIAWEEV